MAKVLFENLFGVVLQLNEGENLHLLGEFMGAWVQIEKELSGFYKGKRPTPTARVVSKLHSEGKITAAQALEFKELQRIRNEVVHGVVEPKDVLDKSIVSRVKSIVKFMALQPDSY